MPTVPTGLNPALGTAIFCAHVGGDAIGISVRSLTTAENLKFALLYHFVSVILCLSIDTLTDGRTDRQTNGHDDWIHRDSMMSRGNSLINMQK